MATTRRVKCLTWDVKQPGSDRRTTYRLISGGRLFILRYDAFGSEYWDETDPTHHVYTIGDSAVHKMGTTSVVELVSND